MSCALCSFEQSPRERVHSETSSGLITSVGTSSWWVSLIALVSVRTMIRQYHDIDCNGVERWTTKLHFAASSAVEFRFRRGIFCWVRREHNYRPWISRGCPLLQRGMGYHWRNLGASRKTAAAFHERGQELLVSLQWYSNSKWHNASSHRDSEQASEDQSQDLCEEWLQREMELSVSCPSRWCRCGHWTWSTTVPRRDRPTNQDSTSAIEKMETKDPP